MRTTVLSLVGLGTVLLVLAGGVNGAPEHKSRDQKDGAAANAALVIHDMTMKDNVFENPNQAGTSDLTIHVGEGVKWTNAGANSHTATSDDIGDTVETFNTGRVKAGQYAVVFFNKAGTYKYHCIYHKNNNPPMTATITVQ